MTTDVVIVGAGVAGLAAAKAAARAGLSFRVLEAKGRTGGRAWTESATLGLPLDHGAHFLHAASDNPFRVVAEATGAPFLAGGYPTRIFAGGWLTPARQAAAEAGFRAALDRVARAGAGDARSVGDLWPGQDALSRGIYEEFLGAPAAEVAAAEHGRYRDTHEDWPLRDGFGALVAAWGAEVPVILECPVTEIDLRGAVVRVVTPRGELEARHVVLTVSTGVLAAEAIRIRPGLPAEVGTALAAVPMGHAGKVAFRCDGGPLAGEPPVHALVSAPDGRFANVHVRPFGRPVVVVIVGGPEWEAIERAGPAALRAEAFRMVETAFGTAATRGAGPATNTAWLGDPFVRGGHSFKRPGAGDARATLARPVHERLHLAGEATSATAWATVHGAHAAAEAAVARIAEGRPTPAARPGVAV